MEYVIIPFMVEEKLRRILGVYYGRFIKSLSSRSSFTRFARDWATLNSSVNVKVIPPDEGKVTSMVEHAFGTGKKPIHLGGNL